MRPKRYLTESVRQQAGQYPEDLHSLSVPPPMTTPEVPGRVFGRQVKAVWGWALAVLLTLPALWPLVRPGFFVSDDGRFHVYRIAALAQAWQQGVLHPRLFPEFGFGYGQAVLNFYAPLSYWPGALFAVLGIGPVVGAKLTIALAFVLSALAAYGYANYLWGPAGGVLAAAAYTYFPYHLADAYLRGAIPELFAFVWPPLILWAYTAAFRREKLLAPFLWGTLAWAALVFTHNLTALLMIPVAALYLVLMAGSTGQWRRLLPAVGTLVLALGLTAPLWVPFLAESSAVGIGLGPSDGYLRHLAPLGRFVQPLLLYHYGLERGGAADHPLSWLTAALFVVVLGLFAWRSLRRQPVEAAPVVGFSLGLTAVAALMATTASLPVWLGTAPLMAQLQYPWRFLALANLGVLGLGGALPRLLFPTAGRGGSEQLRPPVQRSELVRRESAWLNPLVQAGILVFIGGLFIVQALPLVPAQPLPLSDAEAWAPDRMWREDAEAGQVGATWTGEFLPLSVSEQRWALGRFRPNAVDGQAPNPLPDVYVNRLGYLFTELAIQTDDPITLRLHQFDLPGWGARVDGQAMPTYPSGELGLVSVDVPSGVHVARLAFGATPARTVAMVLVVTSAILWGILAWRSRHSGRGLGVAAVVIWSMALLFGLNSLGVGQRSWQPKPVKAAVEDVALLVGYDVTRARGEDALDVTLYWFALRDIGSDFKIFVHMLGEGGQVVAQHDGDPVGGFTPTTRWRSGELIADRHRLLLPASLPEGSYTLKAGMYQFQPLRNLQTEPVTPDGRIYLGDVTLR
jgi:6-pyruvoyl-tetrahydropterin synthase related domain